MLIKKHIFFILVVAIVTAFSGCSGGGSSSSNSGNTGGSAQKGPFANGSVVKAYELVNGVRSGSIVQTTTHGIKGDFTFNSLPWTNPTQIVVTGDYFDEVTGNYRGNGNLSVVIKGGKGKIDGGVNVNILTQITSARIIKLLKEGKSFDEAYVSANNLIEEMFNLDLSNGKGPESLDLTKTDKPDNAKLLQISAALLSTDNPQKVLEDIVEDAKDGNLDGKGDAGVESIKEKIKTVNLQEVAANIDLQVGSHMATHVEQMLQGKLPVDFDLKFIDRFDVELGSQVNSNEVILLGFDGNVSVEAINASAIINGSSILHSGDTRTLPAGTTIKLKAIASSDYGTKKTATLKVNNKSFYFSTTTKSDPNSSTDTTPNSFNLGKKLNAEPSSTVQSDEIVVSGLSKNVFVDVNVTGGKYSVNGVNRNSTISRVTNGDKIKVKLAASNQFSTLQKATLNIGEVSGDFITVTRVRDITPNIFTPATKYNVDLNTPYITDYVTLDGFEGDLPLTVSNGWVQAEGDSSWNIGINSASKGIKVRFKQISANDFDRKKTTAIKLGNYQITFQTITKANPALMDYVPTHFNFPTKRVGIVDGDSISVESDAIAITGIANGNGIKIKSGTRNAQIKINNGNWTSGTIEGVKAGDILKVKILNVNNTVISYGASVEYYDNEDSDYKKFANFGVLTHKITQTPNDIDLGSQTNVNSNGTYFSNTVTISGLSSGIEVDATIVGNGAYAKNGAWESVHNAKNIKLKNGDTIQFRLIFLDEPEGTTESMFLNFKSKSFSFSVTTNKAPIFQTTPSFSNVEVGDHISFTPRVIDDSSLTFSLQNAPSWMNINTATGQITGTVESGRFQDIHLIATDNGGLSSFVTFDLVADVSPTITSDSFQKIFYLDDNSKEKNVFGFSFKISDVDNDISDLNVTLKNEIIHENLSPDGINKGFSESKITCDLSGNCGARIAFDFAREDGLHPSMRTKHYITVSDGDKNVTNYVEVWFAPVKPALSGETQQSVGFTTRMENAYKHYSFVPTNAGNKAQSWSIANKPLWADFNTSSGELSGTPSLDQNGTYKNIQVTATNDRGSDTFTFSIKVVDKTPPKVFELEDYYGVEINQYYDTFVTVDWLADGQSADISSSGYDGQASHSGFTVNGHNDVTSVKNGDIVRVGHLSSNEYDTELHTTITIGDASDDFITRTKASASTKIPLIVGSPKTSANIHERYSYTPQISNDTTKYAPVTKPFEIQNKPDWAAFNTANGELSGTPIAMGVYKNVKIIAHGDNGMDDITFDITISNDGPAMHSSNLSLENENLDLTYNDNSDWRAKVTEVSLFGCAMQSSAVVLDSSDYTFSEGVLQLHVSTSNNVALHVPTFSGYRLIIKATDYNDDSVYTEMVSDGQYGVSATLSTTTALTEENLDGAKVEIALNNALKFKDNVLQSSNFTLAQAPDATHITNARYIDATHAELTLSYNGVDFDSDKVINVAINTNELNTPCANITINTVPVVAIIEKPYINMLYPNDPSEDAQFGYSVVDFNNTIAVGARTGVYIFTKGSDGNYTQTQKIPALDAAEYFGSALAMDGDYLVIADKHHKDANKSAAGMALVYKKGADGNYTQVAALKPTDNEAYDNFGNAVAISKDMILVGAENALREPDRGGRGKAYLYKNDGNDNFTLVETITRDNGKPFDGFGHDVAITHGVAGTNEENTSFMLVGSYVLPDYDATTNTTDTKEELGAGFANYYLYKDGTLSDPVVVTADDSTTLSDHFGSGVALGGNLAVIGSSVRLYSYARGEGNALNARVKIENASAGISGGNVAVNFTGFNNKARNVIVAGRKSFVSNEDSSAYSAYESRLNDNDNLGYSASLSGFEVARGDYANSTLVSKGGAVLVTNAYENITSMTSSAATPPSISEPEYGYGLATDYVDFAFSADDTWKNAITNVLYKAGANAQYVVLGANDYTITSDNNIRLQTAQSTNVALHTPYESHGSLLVKADGYLDDVVTISRVGGGFHAIKAELSSDTALNENNLDGAVIHIALSNTLEFADTALESANFRLVGAPAGVNIDTIIYSDATHADVTLAFDGTDFDDNAILGITLNASELNSYEDVLTTNSLQIEAKSGATTNVTDNNTTHQSSNPLQQHISYVGKYPGMFANEKAFAALKNDGTVVTWGDSDTGGYSNNLNTELINVKAIYSTQYGFAALKNDGSLVTWGANGNMSLTHVQAVYSNQYSVAALKEDGSVVTWGRNSSGEDSSSVSGQLINVKAIYSTYLAFAALKNDGTVVTWGDSASGADSSSVSDQLTNIKALYSTSGAFAALKNDGTVVTWGESDIGGDSSNVSDLLTDVKSIYSNGGAFAALKNNGTVVTWGGTNSSSVSEQLTDVKTIYSTYGAFAALKNDGTVVTWGNSNYGGDSSSVHTQLIHIQGIVASGYAFAALKSDGIVIAWGGVDYENHTISTPGILKNIKAIYSNRESFAAIKSNGRVVTWGNSQHGGSTAGVDTQLTNVQKIYASQYAFAALKEDGTVVAWGDSYYGGDSSSASDKLTDIKSLSASYGDEFVGDFNLTVTDIYDPLQQTLSYPGKYPGMYSNPYAFAVLNDNGTVVTWGDYRYGGDSSSVSDQLTDVKAIYSNSYAFATLKNDSTVVTWGDSNHGGDSSSVSDQLTDIKTIYSTYGAFAALKNNGSVVTWGYSNDGGDSSSVSDQLTDIKTIYSSAGAFASLKNNGSVVTWGSNAYGGDSSSVSDQLTDIKTIYSNSYAFAALKNDGTIISWSNYQAGTQIKEVKTVYSNGSAFAVLKNNGSVVTWGNSDYGGDSSSVSDQLIDIKTVYSNGSAFAALKNNGSVVTWGNSNDGGDSSSVSDQLTDIKTIYSSAGAFASLKNNGSVVTWGSNAYGGNSSSVSDQLTDVKTIYSNRKAFAALKNNGSVVTWGSNAYGGDSSSVSDQLTDIKTIYSSEVAFAALKNNGSVVTWGNSNYGGDSSSVSDQLTDVKAIYFSNYAVAALKNNGSVVTWGNSDDGGDSSSVSDQLTDIKTIYSSVGAFVALKNNGSVVTWGDSNHGGDSSSVSDQLTDIKTIYSNKDQAFVALKNDGTVVTWGGVYNFINGNYIMMNHSNSLINKLTDIKEVFHTVQLFAALNSKGELIIWDNFNDAGDSRGVSDKFVNIQAVSKSY